MAPSYALSLGDVKAALAELDALSIAEYGVGLESLLLNSSPISALRVQRLTGIVLKRPFAVEKSAQLLNATIDNVVLLTKVTGNPATFSVNLDGVAKNLARLDTWGLCKAETTDFSLGNAVQLSLLPANLSKLQEVLLVANYRFS